MKLKSLVVNNFRGLKGDKNRINFGDSQIIFLIGQNNVGKSSFLKAYEFFVAAKKDASLEDFYNHDKTIPIIIEAHFQLEEEDKSDTDLAGSTKDSDPEWAKKWVDTSNVVRIRKTWNAPESTGQKDTLDPSSGNWIKNGFGGFDSLLQKYAPQPIWIDAMETEESLEEKLNKLINDEFLKKAQETYPELYGTALDAVKKLQDSILSSEKVSEFNKNINARFRNVFDELELTICAKTENGMNIGKIIEKQHSIRVGKPGETSRKETFLQHGHGVIRQTLFNFLAFLKDNESVVAKKYIILFEEPELYLHPQVLYRLRESLYQLAEKSQYQVLCATHSPLMIDISKPHSSLVRVVKDRSSEETRTFQVGENIFSKYKQIVMMLNKFNSSICEVFYASNVLIVEGDTEAIAFKTILSELHPKLGLYVLNSGSKMNIPFFQEALSHFGIDYVVVHDSDSIEKKAPWTMNEKIWEQIQSSRNMGVSAKRYVMVENFETANGYEENDTDGKPLSAYKFVSELLRHAPLDEDKPCIKYSHWIACPELDEEHDQKWILDRN